MIGKKKSSVELKCLARGQLLGRYGGFVAALLIEMLITGAVALCTTMHGDVHPAVSAGIAYAVGFLVQIAGFVFLGGFAYMCLQTTQGVHCLATDLFYGFRFHADKLIIIGFLLTAAESVLLLPCQLCIWYYAQTQDAFFFMLGCFCLIAGQIVLIGIRITFAPAPFVLLDFPGYNARQVLSMSRRVMRGHKGRLLYLECSFLPLLLLALLTLGVGLLWVIPYIGMTHAHFYLDLMQPQTEAPPQPGSAVDALL